MVSPSPFTLTCDNADLKFRSISATEEVARLFEFNVSAVAEHGKTIDFAALLGTPACVHCESSENDTRYMHGIIAAAGLDSGIGRRLVSYRLTLRPSLWLLTRRSDTRIFQKMTVDAIIKKVFENYQIEVKWELQGSYPAYEYCVQYRETDFNFVSRLMEREGIYYFFKHSESKHEMVICDKMTSHEALPGFENIVFRESHGSLLDHEAIEQWRTLFELPPGKVTLNDYDYLKPTTPLLADFSSPRSNANAGLEYYDPPGEYIEKAQGTRYAKLRMEELDARYLRVSGSTFTVRGLVAGHLFNLNEHPVDAENDAYVLLSTRIEAHYGGYESGEGETQFDCRFTAMKHSDVFRPERLTPKPIVPGPQTAVVVGPSGEEIYTDVHGRVKVQFHWDRLGQKNENSSCWLRCASHWAGAAWGMISLPRIGQEVVVDFIEGDPDQPLVVNRVYNMDMKTPYLLPDNKTVSTIKSRSTMKGEPANFNELAFEDKKGSEFIRLHAEKDLLQIVKHDAHLEVDNDQFRVVKRDVKEEIGGKTHLKVVGDAKSQYDAKFDTKIAGAVTAKLEAKLDVKTVGAVSVDTDAALSLKTATKADMKFGTALGVEGGTTVHIKSGTTLVIEAGAALTLKGPMINIEASGICSITGSLVKINSGGGGGSGSGASPTAPGSPGAPDAPQPLKDFVKQVDNQLKAGR